MRESKGVRERERESKGEIVCVCVIVSKKRERFNPLSKNLSQFTLSL